MRRMVCLSITATVFTKTKLALYLVGNSRSSKRSRKAWEPPKVKTLAEAEKKGAEKAGLTVDLYQ